MAVSIVKKIALECRVDEIWLLTGQGEMTETEKPSNTKDSNTAKVLTEHQNMLKRFKNPERAKDINERLIEIEEISDEIYNKVDGYVAASRDAARAIQEASGKKIS